MTIVEIDIIVREYFEQTECVLTRQWSRQTSQLPIDYLLPQVQEDLPSEDLLFSQYLTYQEKPYIGTSYYHIPLALNNFTKSSNF
jgi:hypothetical protein